jgi:hypothetical protein
VENIIEPTRCEQLLKQDLSGGTFDCEAHIGAKRDQNASILRVRKVVGDDGLEPPTSSV